MKKYEPIQHFIYGQFSDSHHQETLNNVNPATGKMIGAVANGSEKEVDYAVAAARRALDGPWKEYSKEERAQFIREIGDSILKRADQLAYLESLDTGKLYKQSREIGVPEAARIFHFYADSIASIGNEAFQDKEMFHYTHRHPVDVVGIINPWSMPLLLLAWKLAPALATGNTTVIKTSEWAPLTATVCMEICQDAGLPPGVVNLIHGYDDGMVNDYLAQHPDVDAISFIGEVERGKRIIQDATHTMKKLSLELGGKNPNIIFADSNLGEVIESTIQSSFANQGEMGVAGSRIYVERPVYDEFVNRFKERTQELKIGDPFDEETDIGALISRKHYEQVLTYLDIASRDGGEIVTGGGVPDAAASGYFVEPTIITGLERTSRCLREEIFGPVVTVTPFDMEEEVIMQANDTHYGLSATVWTKDIQRAHRVAQAIRAGVVSVNTWFHRDLRTPFGGMGQSGIGRAGGMHSIDFYTELSTISIKI